MVSGLLRLAMVVLAGQVWLWTGAIPVGKLWVARCAVVPCFGLQQGVFWPRVVYVV